MKNDLKEVDLKQEVEVTEKPFVPGPYVNREQSWIDFNYRVLDEAYDKTNLIMDRFKFLGITASNLDECATRL